MKIIKKIFGIFLMVGMLGACDNLKMDGLQTDPNSPTTESAGIDDLYNNIQLEFRNCYNSTQRTPGALVRMYSATSYSYQEMVTQTTLNGLWGNAYNDLFPDIDELIELGGDQDFGIHTGSAKIMKAYVLMMMVDLLGDIPMSEAGLGVDVISPGLDDDQSVYSAAKALLNEAIAELGATSGPPPAYDNFYGGNGDQWIRAANSLLLRAAMNEGDAASFNSLLTGGNLISSTGDDFQFQYGSQRSTPDSRHPFYANHYETGDGDYLSNYFMWLLFEGRTSVISGNSFTDPRIRYYFYRKVDDAFDQDQTTFACHLSDLPDLAEKPAHWDPVNPDLPYCVIEAGYSGRDHLNGQGIPPDGPIRTSYGLYPFGGDFDDDSFGDTRLEGTTGGGGAGIVPIMLASFVDFMVAEGSIRFNGDAAEARARLESGITKSLNKVESFESLVAAKMAKELELRSGETGTVADLYSMGRCAVIDDMGTPADPSDDVCVADQKQNYVNEIMALYDDPGANQLDIVIKEFYIAAWGNGLEAYNMYRRTGYPAGIMPSLEVDPGAFPLSFLYPAVSVDRNANILQKTMTDQVFWQDPAIASSLY